MPTSFMENLRKPKKLPRWAPTGEIRAGESDPYHRHGDCHGGGDAPHGGNEPAGQRYSERMHA